MACQLSFKTARYIDVPVNSPVEISRCNVLVVDNEDAVGSRHEVAVEEHGRDYVFRLWAMSNQSSICSQCGIIQNHRGLEWYTKLTGLRLNVGAVHNTPHWRLRNFPNHYGTDSRGGIEQAYVIALSRYFNFTYNVVTDAESKFGGLDGDKWSGMEAREGPLATVRSCMVRHPDDLVPDKQQGLDRALRQNYAYIDTQRGLSAALHDRHATAIEVSTGHVGTTIMSLAMHKTCFYRNAFSTVSRRLVESGHFLKWERQDQPVRPKMKHSHFKAIELSDVFSHGTILIAGYGLALVALVSEYARFRYASRRRPGQDQQRPTENTAKAVACTLVRPRRAKKTQRRQSIQRSSSVVAIAVPTPLPPLHPLKRPPRWETRVVGQSGFKRVSINLGPHAFPKIDSTAGLLPLEASGTGGQARRDDRCALPNLPPVSTT
ncbi:hypothetical protein HPB52_001941 [Rhipicephalus sanguineus]|uniref:Ionotropic receptor n=1 Tax=Rhipicephalus sanguineus TaxID=34632 RepID=A0A9D4SVF4_RHISA|nr:hypothetical protein HPB52_001941 [Rhipicephalus sanguineus]